MLRLDVALTVEQRRHRELVEDDHHHRGRFPPAACTVSCGEADAHASREVGATNKNTAVTTTGATAKKRNTERSDPLR